ncbi:MerR family transcriptional regulator [Paenibacillus harenae]|uniref:MerR family transcriptional regulator n=1 Tax=Paenibacillus harenae TaxID=306543 RepID=UPI0003F9B89F|nr:MerR family transcriptional regulator [Paenibacillus harenae]
MALRPADIARKLNISTSSLRHYEEWGLIPPVERSAKGYRVYTEFHVAFFECIRAMADGFGLQLTAEVLKNIHTNRVNFAFWLVNEAQSSLHNEKIISEKTLKSLEEPLIAQEGPLTISEISRETGIPTTTIRYWEKVGLLTIPRDNENKYRILNQNHIRQIRVIHTLKSSPYVYTYSLNGIKEIIRELKSDDFDKIRKISTDYQIHLDRMNQLQMKGVRYLYQLCEKLELIP